MFKINEDKSFYLTRGDIAIFTISAKKLSGNQHQFQIGDIIRFKVFEKKDCKCVVIQKDIEIEEATTSVVMTLEKEKTKIGDIISKPKDYWYEVELNPDTAPQTIIGYDEDGAKLFKLFPEGSDINV